MVIPSFFHSLIKEVPVFGLKKLNKKHGVLGRVQRHSSRQIQIDTSQDPEAQRQAFWHEVMHLFLWDSGLLNLINNKQEEFLCDAFGSYMAAAMERGYIQWGPAGIPSEDQQAPHIDEQGF